MKNKNILYAVGGLVIGLVLSGSFCFLNHHRGFDDDYGMMHKMSNGSIMTNNSMDMNAMMESMNKVLDGKTGDDFDKAFISEMIIHHEGAVKMAEKVLQTSKRPELLKLANDIIIAQSKEIGMMKDWQKAWFVK
ncbi:MAG: DUF305 domain-containing protein [bacterium]|nr:DUF305 domain-containing protein [bacterium]